ncbi:MAG: NADH-quinone oxidoreductase subunit M, partial [Methylobacter sp.]|nr:NADH-quinone oxidoreductase subunit M [Methylobacter sp.]
MNNVSFPVLSMLILLPLVGAFAVAVSRDIRLAKLIALVFAGLELITTLVVVNLFDSDLGGNFQLLERHAWIPSLNIDYLIGVDGIALLFLPVSAVLTLMVIMASWN